MKEDTQKELIGYDSFYIKKSRKCKSICSVRMQISVCLRIGWWTWRDRSLWQPLEIVSLFIILPIVMVLQMRERERVKLIKLYTLTMCSFLCQLYFNITLGRGISELQTSATQQSFTPPLLISPKIL